MGSEGRKARSKRSKAEGPEQDLLGEEEAEIAREVMDRAIRRLDLLEYFILLFALLLALLGGALVAWVLGRSLGLPFRWTWAGASLLLFIVPGGFAYLRERRSRRAPKSLDVNTKPKDPHG